MKTTGSFRFWYIFIVLCFHSPNKGTLFSRAKFPIAVESVKFPVNITGESSNCRYSRSEGTSASKASAISLSFVRPKLKSSRSMSATDLYAPDSCYIFTLFFGDGFALNGIFINIVLFITGGTGRFVNSLTDFWAASFQFEWSVTEFNSFLGSNLSEFNETVLDEVFFAFFFLLRFEVGCVSGVTFFTITVLTCYNIIVFGFFNHDNFVDTSFTSSSNGSNVKSDIVSTTTSLTGSTGIVSSMMFMVSMITVVSSMVVTMMGSVIVILSSIEWESSTKVFSGPLARGQGGEKDYANNAELCHFQCFY